MKEIKQTRFLAYDILRIISAFGVVMLHSAASYWYIGPMTTWDWQAANVYEGMVRICVPIFVMISGALFLKEKEAPDRKKLVCHNIFRLVFIYLLWSVMYGVKDCLEWGFSNLTPAQIFAALLNGGYHLWYLPMLGGLYALTPVLYEMVHAIQKKTLEYYFILFFLFQGVRSSLTALCMGSEFWTEQLGQLEIPMVCSYISYYLLGFYIAEYGISKKWLTILKWGILPVGIINVSVGALISILLGIPDMGFFDSYAAGSIFLATAIFGMILDRFKNRCSDSRLLGELAGNTFGIYLVHVWVMDILYQLGVQGQTIPVIIWIPIRTILVFFVSFLITAVIRRIPFLGKYLC